MEKKRISVYQKEEPWADALELIIKYILKAVDWLAKATLTFSTAALIYYELETKGTISGLSLAPAALGFIWQLTIAIVKDTKRGLSDDDE